MNKTSFALRPKRGAWLLCGLLAWVQWTSALPAAEAAPMTPEEVLTFFRNAFAEELHGEYAAYDLERMILYPTPALLTPYAGGVRSAGEEEGGDDDPFAELRLTLRGVSPTQLFEEGHQRGFTRLPGVDRWAAQFEPPTLVLIPGMLTEFVGVSPYAEVLAGDSQFKRRWQRLLADLPAALQTAKVYSMHTFREEDVPTRELFEVGSLDAEDGRELVRYVFLRPRLGSFETIGSLASKVKLYQERLDLLFAVLGQVPPFYLLGYSQGAHIALQVSTRMQDDKDTHPWYGSLRGVVSIGGPLFGSELADMAAEPGELSHDILATLQNLAEELRADYKSVVEIPAVVARNSWLWQRAMIRLGVLFTRYERPVSPLDQEPRPEQPAALRGAALAFVQQLERLFHLKVPPWDYFNNVRRFKMVVAQTLEAGQAMRSTSRRQWWQTHTLPPQLSYYAVTAVMADAYRPGGTRSPLLRSEWYGQETLDYPLLRRLFYDIFRRTALDLNDSQVTLHQAMFWPDLHTALNQQQAPYHAYTLGILGTHHWGMAIEGVLVGEQSFANPFPRRALLKAMGLTLLKNEAARGEASARAPL